MKILLALIGYYSSLPIVDISILSEDEIERIPLFYNNARMWVVFMKEHGIFLSIDELLDHLYRLDKLWKQMGIPVDIGTVDQLLKEYPHILYRWVQTLYKGAYRWMCDIDIICA
jgi:hypothetical protein